MVSLVLGQPVVSLTDVYSTNNHLGGNKSKIQKIDITKDRLTGTIMRYHFRLLTVIGKGY